VTGKVNVAPAATVVGRDEFRHDHIARLEVQYFMVMAVPALQVIVSGDEAPTVTEPNAAGLGVHVRGGVTAGPLLPTAAILPWTPTYARPLPKATR
jgi:hypothetical protein